MTKPSLDIDTLTIDQMLDLKDALEAKLIEIAKSEAATMAERLERLRAYLPEEMSTPIQAKKSVRKSAKAPKASKAKPKSKHQKSGKLAPKFRDPVTGKTWSGRGMVPVWLRDYEAAGRGRTEFSVQRQRD
ncbi:MAG: H-NS histone family protein [Pseudomonadota bacterium]